MSPERKSNFSIALALLAVLISGFTLYVAHLRPIELTMTLEPWTYASNTSGGLPDLYLGLALSAEGPSSSSLSVRELQGTLTRIENGVAVGEELSLVASSGSEGLPTVLSGGEVINLPQVLLVSAESASVRIKRYAKWCNELRGIFPEKKSEIDQIESILKLPFFSDTIVPSIEAGDGVLSLTKLVSDLLKGGKVEDLQRVLFFRAGTYELQLQVIHENGDVGATETRQFSIDEVASKVLLHKFNENFRLDMRDPAGGQ